MENRYPLFAGGRILKKEALWDLRDYAYESWQIYFADYTDGIIKGCRVRVEGSDLVIGRGVLKYGEFIYLVQEEEKIPYHAENKTVILKAVFDKKSDHPDYMAYQVKFFLDKESELKKGEIELCRFHLREGSQLRENYKNFADMGTEYDTIILIYATLAGRYTGRMHPDILLRFAEEIRDRGIKSIEDYVLCYQIWGNAGEVERTMIDAYLSDKAEVITHKEVRSWDVKRIFDSMIRILDKGICQEKGKRRENIIYVE